MDTFAKSRNHRTEITGCGEALYEQAETPLVAMWS